MSTIKTAPPPQPPHVRVQPQDLVLGHAVAEGLHRAEGAAEDRLEEADVSGRALVDALRPIRLGPIRPDPSGMWQDWHHVS